MSGNQIPTLHALDSQLKHITTLETLYLEGNPCQTTDMAGYRRKIILALPQLKQIDATYVHSHFRLGHFSVATQICESIAKRAQLLRKRFLMCVSRSLEYDFCTYLQAKYNTLYDRLEIVCEIAL
jgi:hypothetical protein